MKKLVIAAAAAVLLAVTEIPRTEPVPEGAYAVWQVPCIQASLPIYEEVGRNGQALIDAEDSGCIWQYGRGRCIGDHAGSEAGRGIWAVETIEIGCGGFMIREGKPATCYECTALYLCRQAGAYYQWHGQTIFPKKDDLICVSCAEEDGYVYLAYFEKLGEMP